MRGSVGEFLFLSEDRGRHLTLRTAAAVSASVAGSRQKGHATHRAGVQPWSEPGPVDAAEPLKGPQSLHDGAGADGSCPGSREAACFP